MNNSKDNFLEILQVSYENDKTLQSIIHFSGISIFFDQLVSQRVKEIRLERSKTFFDELESGLKQLDDETIKSEDFLHKFFISYKAAINTRRREKTKMFSNLFKSSLLKTDVSIVDTFEDYLKILDELSYREIQALYILESFYSTPRNSDDSNLNWTDKFWDKFVSKLSTDVKISPEKVDSFMIRVSRTGCYELFTGKIISGGTGGKGILTPIFFDLKEYALKVSTT